MAIYTKKGDKGKTSLITPKGKEILKSDQRLRTIGTVDEANSFLGVCTTFVEDQEVLDLIFLAQENLFKINSILARAPLRFSSAQTTKLEREIDKMERELPVLKNFIFPSGSKAGSLIHASRTIIRRAEREMVSLDRVDQVRPQIIQYINRLSDFLFVLARKVNYQDKTIERKWKT